MKPKIIFIINAITAQRCLKRIEEFIANGYEIKAYGFSRSESRHNSPQNFQIEVIGQYDNHLSYIKRVLYMLKALYPIFKRYKNENVIYYYFLLDVAMVSRVLCRSTYIYEESDMMQALLHNKFLHAFLDFIDRLIIKHSLITVMTSEGFAAYHYGRQYPNNIIFIPNRLNKKILQLSYTPTPVNVNHLRFAFVGATRSYDLANFIQIIGNHFPQHEFHIYGVIEDNTQLFHELVDTYNNVYYHGVYANPQDLPRIYQNIDILVATYGTQDANVRFLEPNKLYDAAYFQKPIIVSEGTFTSDKVRKWGIGFSINALDSKSVISFLQSITLEDIHNCIQHCQSLEKSALIDENSELFNRLSTLIS